MMLPGRAVPDNPFETLTMKNAAQLAVCLALAASSAACIGFERKSTVTGPSASGLSTLMGSWSSANLIPAPGACSDFKWNVAEQTSNSAKGSFSARCAGDLKLEGTAEGTLSGSTIAWKAQGVGSAPGLPSCAISLAGTAEIGIDSVRVPYAGDTCLGTVSGVEILKRN
jgi:hypothetical protein